MSSAFVMHTPGHVEERSDGWYLVIERDGKALVSFWLDTVEPKMPVTLSICVGGPRMLSGPNPRSNKVLPKIDYKAGEL